MTENARVSAVEPYGFRVVVRFATLIFISLAKL
jgi:hypothetical protein